MTHFRLLARTRQVTEYSCGACALQAVMSYWGKNVGESELMKVLHTTSEPQGSRIATRRAPWRGFLIFARWRALTVQIRGISTAI